MIKYPSLTIFHDFLLLQICYSDKMGKKKYLDQSEMSQINKLFFQGLDNLEI